MAVTVRHEYTCDRCGSQYEPPGGLYVEEDRVPRLVITCSAGEPTGRDGCMDVRFLDLCLRCDAYCARLVEHIANPRKRGRKPADARTRGPRRKAKAGHPADVEPVVKGYQPTRETRPADPRPPKSGTAAVGPSPTPEQVEP